MDRDASTLVGSGGSSGLRLLTCEFNRGGGVASGSWRFRFFIAHGFFTCFVLEGISVRRWVLPKASVVLVTKTQH